MEAARTTDAVEARWEAHNEAGRRFFSQGQFAKAEEAFVAAVREATVLGADNLRLASSLSNLGQLKYKQKDLGQAELLFRKSLSIRERALGADHPGVVQCINNLAALYLGKGDLKQAEALFLRALTLSERHLGESHPDVAVTLNNLARLYFRQNDFASTAPLLLRLLAIKEEAHGAEHPEVAAILTSLVKVRCAEGEYDAAEQLARRLLSTRERIHAPDDPAVATVAELLADICAARGKHDEQQQLRERAKAIRGGTPIPEQPGASAADAVARDTSAPIELPHSAEVPIDPPKIDRPAPANADGPTVPEPRITATVAMPQPEPPAAQLDVEERPAPANLVAPQPAVEVEAPAPAERPEAVDRHAAVPPAARRAANVRAWSLEPRRSWIKIVVAAGVVLLVGVGGLALRTRGEASDRPPSTRSAQATGANTDEELWSAEPEEESALAADDDEAFMGEHVDPSMPSQTGSGPESRRGVIAPEQGTSRGAKRDAERGGAVHPVLVDHATVPEISAPAHRTVNVERITTAIDESARARADSASRTMDVQPPTFDKPRD